MAVTTRTRSETAPRVTPGIYIGLGLVTLATLMLEIALTRIFSVTMWYHFAFGAADPGSSRGGGARARGSQP